LIDTKAIRTKILDLAIQGKLTDQRVEDGTGEELYKRIKEERLSSTKKNEKVLSDIDDSERLINIPQNWTWCRLRKICTTDITYGIIKLGDEEPDGIHVLRCSDVKENYIDTDNIRTVTPELSQEYSRTILCGGEIVINVRGTLGGCALVPYEMKGYNVAREVAVIRQNSAIDGRFLVFVLLSPYFERFMRKMLRGVAYVGLNIAQLSTLPVPLPPLAEQKRIAEAVGNIFSVLDSIDEYQKQYQNNIGILKEKLVEASIQGKLTEQLPEDGTAEELYQQILAEKQGLVKTKRIKKEQPLPPIETKDIPFPIPTNWKWVRLGDIARKIASGNTPTGGRNSDVYVQSGYCLFREQNIYNDGIHEEGMVYITEELLATRENSTVYAGDILLNITGGSIGRCAVVPDSFDRGSVNQHILIIRMIDERLRHYIHKVICSPYAQKYINQKAFGDKGGFSGTRCKMMPIPLPPLEEQKRIVERIDSIYASI